MQQLVLFTFLEFMIVVLPKLPLLQFQFYVDRVFACPLFSASCFWSLPCEHGAGPADIGVFRDMFASSVASDAACVRACRPVQRALTRLLSVEVSALRIFPWQGLHTWGQETHGIVRRAGIVQFLLGLNTLIELA